MLGGEWERRIIISHSFIQQIFEYHLYSKHCSKDLGQLIKQNIEEKKIPALLGTFHLGDTDKKQKM